MMRRSWEILLHSEWPEQILPKHPELHEVRLRQFWNHILESASHQFFFQFFSAFFLTFSFPQFLMTSKCQCHPVVSSASGPPGSWGHALLSHQGARPQTSSEFPGNPDTGRPLCFQIQGMCHVGLAFSCIHGSKPLPWQRNFEERETRRWFLELLNSGNLNVDWHLTHWISWLHSFQVLSTVEIELEYFSGITQYPLCLPLFHWHHFEVEESIFQASQKLPHLSMNPNKKPCYSFPLRSVTGRIRSQLGQSGASQFDCHPKALALARAKRESLEYKFKIT